MVNTEFIENLFDEQAYVIFATLISADTLIDVEHCKACLAISNKLSEAIQCSNISETKKNEWLAYLENGKKIIEQDLNDFEHGRTE